MIENLHIERFMDMIDETLVIKPLTVITGINSAGKSAVVQSVLAVLKQADVQGKFLLKSYDFSFKSAVCKYDVYPDYKISVGSDTGEIFMSVNSEEQISLGGDTLLNLEKNAFYLSANRKGYDIFEQKADDCPVGVQGEYLFGSLHKEKDNPISLKINGVEEPKTLGSQVDYWLREILGMKFSVKTEEKNSNIVVSYDADDVKDLMPNQLGTAVSYLAKVLIMCLRTKPGDVLMIENPEIHLHPKAQGKLGEFLIYIVNAGVQVIVETHSEHVINKIQYQIYSKKFDADKLALYYKNAARESFERIEIDGNGRYVVDFPEGFFDASLGELLEIG